MTTYRFAVEWSALALSNALSGWDSAGATDVGLVRQLNEDSFLDRPDLGLWVVADGMGGHSSGDVASQMLCATLAEMPYLEELSTVVDFVDDNIGSVNRELVTLAQSKQRGSVIGSTVVAMVARNGHGVCLWAGDSRLYRMRKGVLTMLSEDHSFVAESEGAASDYDAEYANIVTRAVGASDTLCLDIDVFNLLDGDRFLLCSDGLSKELADGEINRFLLDGSVTACSRLLIDNALRAGGTDNITAVVADYHFSPGH